MRIPVDPDPQAGFTEFGEDGEYCFRRIIPFPDNFAACMKCKTKAHHPVIYPPQTNNKITYKSSLHQSHFPVKNC